MLQLAAYANYFDFGLQTAVARYLAGALERKDGQELDRLMSTATAILAAVGLLVAVGMGILSWQLPHLFRTAPVAIVGEIQAGTLMLGLLAAAALPLSAFAGALAGMQRNEFLAATVGGSRLCGALAVVVAARYTHSLLWLAVILGGFNLLGGVVQFLIAGRLLGSYKVKISAFHRETVAELLRYCSVLAIWSFGMLLISGLDVTIVGMYNFRNAGAYSIASTLITFFTGLSGAAFSAMLAPIAVMQAREEFGRIERLVLMTTRLGTYFNLAAVVATFLFGETLVRIWVGSSYLFVTLPVLEILMVAQAVRLTGNALGIMLVGTGNQKYGILPNMVEAVSNLILSVAGVIWMGAAGVAWATLIAAVIGICVGIGTILPRVKVVQIAPRLFLEQGVLLPLLVFLPAVLWIAVRLIFREEMALHAGLSGGMTAVVAVATLLLRRRGIGEARRQNA